MMRICYVCDEYPPAVHGGIGAVTQLLAEGMASRGHAVEVVGMYRGLTERRIEHDGTVRVRRIPLGGPSAWSSTVARFRLRDVIAGMIQSEGIELVEVPDYLGWAARLAGLRVPVVIRAHASSTFISTDLGRRPDARHRRLEARGFRVADAWCAVSAYLADRTRRWLGADREAEVIPNAVVLPEATPFEERDLDLAIFSGTLNHRKGIMQLLRSWRSVREAHPAARLHVLGKPGLLLDGSPIRPEIHRLIPDPEAAGITFYGHVPRTSLLARLRLARVAVFPSHAEGFAMAPLEAMSTGCPTIYTRRGSGPEVIDHGVDGLLVDPEAPADIADAINRVFDDDILASRIGAAARERVGRDFEVGGWIRQNEEFYRRCLSRYAGS